MRLAAYDLAQFAPRQNEPAEKTVEIVDNPRRKNSRKEYRARVVFCSLLLLVMMALTVYNNMLLTQTRAGVVGKNEELRRLESEYSFLNVQLENMVSLENAADYAENELGLIKMSAGQIEYINLRGDNRIVDGETAKEQDLWAEAKKAVTGLFE